MINATEYKRKYRKPKASHTACLIDYLERYGSITQLEALIAFGCFRLSARVWDAKHKLNYNILTDFSEEGYAIYRFA